MGKKGSSAAPGAPAEETEFSLIPRGMLERLYANLLKERMLAKRERQAKGPREGGWAAVKAATAAVMMDASDGDAVATADTIPLMRLLRGENVVTLSQSPKGARGAGADGLAHAVGVSLANKTKKNGKVVVVLWRDAELEGWRDVLEMARAHTLPMILVCPAGEEVKPERKKADGMTPGTELPRIVVDGYDPVAVYRVAHESIDRARRDRGATLIECASVRLAGQRGSHGDAVANMERYLRGKGMLRRGMKNEIEEGFAAELKAAKAAEKKAGKKQVRA